MLKDLVARSRSIRRFDQSVALSTLTLRELVELARLSPSGANRQPLKYYLVTEPGLNARIFPCLGWAGYLRDWEGPVEEERPTGYILVLGDREISTNFGVDHGIAAQSIMLGAAEKGLGGCILASVDRDRLRGILELDARYEILLVLALGKPVEAVVVEPVGPEGSIEYWRDEQGIHHVPKRALDELIVGSVSC